MKYYAIEDVPYVQYFAKGVGLHGAFWHRGFGHVRSHGCVNLAPLDAQRLFAFTSPHLPAGWTAVLPTAIGRRHARSRGIVTRQGRSTQPKSRLSDPGVPGALAVQHFFCSDLDEP